MLDHFAQFHLLYRLTYLLVEYNAYCLLLHTRYKKYDADYYIEHQVLPAVMKILRELGVTEDELKYKGKQTGLSGW